MVQQHCVQRACCLAYFRVAFHRQGFCSVDAAGKLRVLLFCSCSVVVIAAFDASSDVLPLLPLPLLPRPLSFGRLSLTRQGLLQRNNLVYSTALEAGVPLCISMGGG